MFVPVGLYGAQKWMRAGYRWCEMTLQSRRITMLKYARKAMKILDPNMPNGTYDWRDGRRVTKEGVRLYIEGTDTLAGRYAGSDLLCRD